MLKLWFSKLFKEHPQRPHNMAAEMGDIWRDKNVPGTSFLIFFYFIFFKYRYYSFSLLSFVLELGTLPSENIRIVCNLSELNDAEIWTQADANYSCRIIVLTNFRLCSSESFKKCEVIPQKY